IQFTAGGPLSWDCQIWVETTAGTYSTTYVDFGASTANVVIAGTSKSTPSYSQGVDTCRLGLNSNGTLYFIVYSGTSSTVKSSYTSTATYMGSYSVNMRTPNGNTLAVYDSFSSILVLK